MKKILSILLIVVILFAMQSIFVFAETVNTPTVEDLGNGYYTITVIENIPSPNTLFAASTSTTKSKTTYFKNKNNETLWYVKVTGTFTYNKYKVCNLNLQSNRCILLTKHTHHLIKCTAARGAPLNRYARTPSAPRKRTVFIFL